jgi:putative two-component system response regulator
MASIEVFIAEEKPSILVVDDLLPNLELLEAIFTRNGFVVFTALDAYSAIEIFETQKVDIAVLDVMMPGMDGYELCKTIKEMNEKQFFPVILLTALIDKQSKIIGLESGADDFISKPFDTEELITKVKSLLRLKNLQDDLEHSENVILTLAVAMESRDPYTRGHSTRVGDISKSFAAFLGFGGKVQQQLRKAGIVHDIGKIGLSSAVLCKEGDLTAEEFDEIRRHTLIGEEICKPLVSMRDTLPAIRNHHERWDGKGFPDGLRGEEIPLYARVLSIADSFDAMVSRRPYREGRSVASALEVLKLERDDGQWDPILTSHFLEMMQVTGLKRVVNA